MTSAAIRATQTSTGNAGIRGRSGLAGRSVEVKKAASPAVQLPRKAKGTSGLDDAFAAMEAKDKQEVLTQIGKDLARSVGANVVAQMLNASGLSGREFEKTYGFDHTALSRLARGEAKSGPTLWKIFALSHALGFKIELSATKED